MIAICSWQDPQYRTFYACIKFLHYGCTLLGRFVNEVKRSLPSCVGGRSFAIATPGGARVWKTASASNQGTPWAARSQQQRSQPGVRTLVVAESPRRQSSSTLGQHRPGEESNGAPRTPAAMARRIISVLNDASSPRSPVQVGSDTQKLCWRIHSHTYAKAAIFFSVDQREIPESCVRNGMVQHLML